jgi:hypothetical protein
MLKFNQFLIKENKEVEDTKIVNLKNKLDTLINNQLREFVENGFRILTNIVYHFDFDGKTINTYYGFSIGYIHPWDCVKSDEQTNKVLLEIYKKCIKFLISKFGEDKISMRHGDVDADKKYLLFKNTGALYKNIAMNDDAWGFKLSKDRHADSSLSTLVLLKTEKLTINSLLSIFKYKEDKNNYYSKDASGVIDGMFIPIEDFLGGIVTLNIRLKMTEYIYIQVQKSIEGDFNPRLDSAYEWLARGYITNALTNLDVSKKFSLNDLVEKYEKEIVEIIKPKHKQEIENIVLAKNEEHIKKICDAYLNMLGMSGENFMLEDKSMCFIPFSPVVNTMMLDAIWSFLRSYTNLSDVDLISTPDRLITCIYPDTKIKYTFDRFIKKEVGKIKLDNTLKKEIYSLCLKDSTNS